MSGKSYERMIADHAYWADRVRSLRKAGAEEIEECSSLAISSGMVYGETCISEAIKASREPSDIYPESGNDFEEIWDEMVADGLICNHYQEVRRLKSERMVAVRRLGSIRAGITRAGRNINKARGE